MNKINAQNINGARYYLFDFLLYEKMDQRDWIKYWVKNEIEFAGTFEILTAL